ncbi:hypothetical protein [Anaerocolumna sp.]|uniref:hypothetical protein n=1 Tax=Anaerocolumna sp. TaxID=2041569 RepID=UPI0028AD2519|nr:hypothetical protein [Anaerocolumna sp.]
MVKELFDNNIIIYIMCGLFGFGILLKLVLSLIYSGLVRASENMGSAKNKLTQLMKLKFETFYKLKIGVNNVDIFVDKYVYHHKFCGVLLSTWENIGGQVLMLCLLIGSVSSILGLIYECGKTQILSVFSVGIITSGLLIVLEGILNLSGKKELIRLNMKDYLENFLKVRLEQQALSPEMVEQYKKEYLEKEDRDPVAMKPIMAVADSSFIMVEKTESVSKSFANKENRTSKKERKELARMEAAQIREAVILEKKRRKEEGKERKLQLKLDKEQAKKDKKEEAIARRLEEQRIKEMKKEETKLALEHKRAEERAEMEQKREELRKAEERRREEKIRQEEIRKALLLEKRIAKEDKKNHGTEQKTIAQERKENLMREIQERREAENTVKKQNQEEELGMLNEKGSSEKEAPILYVKEPTDNIKEAKTASKDSIAESKEVNSKESINELFSTDDKKESSKSGKLYQNKTQNRVSSSKRRKSPDQLEDKLIEDILKEFLA